MPHAAFFRNLNQGQRGSPSAAQLGEALTAAGASEVRLVRGNGTAVFTAVDPSRTLSDAVTRLSEETFWNDVAFARPFEWLAALVQQEFDGKTELSLFDATATGFPIAGRRCTVIDGGAGWAVTTNERERESNATPTLERALGVPVTSRAIGTIRLLLA